MIRQFRDVASLHRALIRRPAELLPYNVSPGWAAMALGVHRATISTLITQGTLDAVKTDCGLVLLRRAEVTAYGRWLRQGPKRARSVRGRMWMVNKGHRDPGKSTGKEETATTVGDSATIPMA